MVIANGNGFSAFSYITPIMKRPRKEICKIKKGANLPLGLRLVQDLRPGHEGHYMIAPASEKVLGLLEELGMDRARVTSMTEMELASV